ncbi:diguanylate cyclase [Jeotgalibacillus soli]|nr:diguanylate cyclase [Jeotgalibacillus soli]
MLLLLLLFASAVIFMEKGVAIYIPVFLAGAVSITILYFFAYKEDFFLHSGGPIILFYILLTYGLPAFVLTCVTATFLQLLFVRHQRSSFQRVTALLFAGMVILFVAAAFQIIDFSTGQPSILLAALAYLIFVSLIWIISYQLSGWFCKKEMDLFALFKSAFVSSLVQWALFIPLSLLSIASPLILLLSITGVFVTLQYASSQIIPRLRLFGFIRIVYKAVLEIEQQHTLEAITRRLAYRLQSTLMTEGIYLKMGNEASQYPPKSFSSIQWTSSVHHTDYQTFSHRKMSGEIQTVFIRHYQWGSFRPVTIGLLFPSKTIHAKQMSLAILPLLHTLGLVQSNWDREKKLLERAETDRLTGLKNQRAYYEIVEKGREAIEHFPLSFFVMDIDNFKKFNDQYGHSIGDEVLAGTACRIQETLRDLEILHSSDLPVYRSGGEEFSILLEECTVKQALHIGESIRQSLANKPFTFTLNQNEVPEEIKSTVTLSMGVHTIEGIEEWNHNLCRTILEEGFHQADHALVHGAKKMGKNQVVHSQEMSKNQLSEIAT